MTNRRAGAKGTEGGAADRGRWSSRRKTDVVLRLVRGEDLDSVSRELGVGAAMLAQWRDEFLAAGQASLRTRQADQREDEIARMQSKIGEITMENELLRERARRAEAAHPFVIAEVEAVGQTISPSANRPYGLTFTCRVLELARSTVYAARSKVVPLPQGKRGPKTTWNDTELTQHIRDVLATSPWLGEGYRKVWARLRQAGIRTSQARVLRLMREANLLAPTRCGHAHGPKAHDGTITTDRPDEMWGYRRRQRPHRRRPGRGVHRGRPLHPGVHRHPRHSAGHAVRGPGADPAGNPGALQRLPREDPTGADPEPRQRQPVLLALLSG